MLYGDTGGLAPDFASRIEDLLSRCPGLSITSGLRTTQQQAALYNQCLAERGSAEACRSWVAVPGRSLHEQGIAVDVGGDRGCMSAFLAELGLCRPLPNEPWHVELCGGVQSSAQIPVIVDSYVPPDFSALYPDLETMPRISFGPGVPEDYESGSGGDQGVLYAAGLALAAVALYSIL